MRTTAAVLDQVLGHLGHPAPVHESLAAAHQAAWATTDPVTLELCRLRVAQLLDNAEELATDLAPSLVAAIGAWPASDLLTATQHACLAFTEEFVIDVASLSDATATAVLDALGEQGYADFVNALLVIEQRQRMRLAWTRLFPEVFA